MTNKKLDKEERDVKIEKMDFLQQQIYHWSDLILKILVQHMIKEKKMF